MLKIKSRTQLREASEVEGEVMSRLPRVVPVILVILLLMLLAAAVFLWITVRRPFPQTRGDITLDGLDAEVNVYRDAAGIPHIYAESERDMYFAQGFVHAQDRFWQMEFWRHLGQGRLSEILGEDILETDRFIRTIGWNRMAQTHLAYYEREAPEMMEILDAYSAGVNAYLAQNGENFSLNQTILGLVQEPWEIEPWEPLDTISWGVVMAWDLGGNWDDELARVRLNQELGEAATSIILPGYPYDSRPVIARLDQIENGLPAEEAPSEEDENGDSSDSEAFQADSGERVAWSRVDTTLAGQPPDFGLVRASLATGSNSWVVSGEHTETGMPLLANDPHLGIQMPSIWYEMGLHAPDHNVVGFSFAGVPGVIIGHNEHIAWGFTNVGPDVQDLYIEKINPADPLQYEFEGEWHDMDVIEEVIGVNGGDDVVVEVRETQHGPIINDVVDGQSDVLAFRWTVQEENPIFQAIRLLNEARNYDDFREALRYFEAPSQSVVYADVEGNIAYQMPGRIPLRANGDGLIPAPGWTGENEWEDNIPFEELPAVLNPDEGFIVTANNAVTEEAYPYYLTHYWADGDRAQRIKELLEEAIARGDVDADDFARIQMDGRTLLAESYIPLLEGLSSSDRRVQAAIERMRGWDRQTDPASVPAALFEVFNMQLAHAALADELGEASDDYLSNSGGAQRVFLHQLAQQPDARWWDDVTTGETEDRQEIIHQALSATVDWFEENVGSDMESWNWGELHTATFVSDPLGQSGIGLIESIVNRGPYAVGGTTSAVNATSWSWNNVAAVGGHPSMRMIVDMSDLDNGRVIHPTGQSGHPFHSHYDDFIEMWINGEYRTLRFNREAVQEAQVDTLLLQPQE